MLEIKTKRLPCFFYEQRSDLTIAKPNFLFAPIYNKTTGMYGGPTKKLAHITMRGDVNERCYSYGYNKE